LRGVVPVPLDDGGSVEFVKRVIGEVKPRLILGSRYRIRTLDHAIPRIAFEEFEGTLPPEPSLQPVAGLHENDTLQIVFTSGTTGEPKGVVHTHRNVLASLRPIEREMQKYLKYERLVHPLRIMNTLPLSHVFGQFMGIWIPPLLGAVIYFDSRLLPADLTDSLRRERISVLATVPRVAEMIESHLVDRFPDLPVRLQRAQGSSAATRWWKLLDVHRALGWKFWAVISGGATLPEEVEHFWTALGLVVIQGYGMTETAALVSLVHPFHPVRGSIGKVLPGREIRLSPEGEILVKGETVSGASWAGGAMRPRESEWLATGDLGALDASGSLSFRGRKKDVIVTASGLKIFPEDLEACLLRQPGVRDAAVVEESGALGPHPVAVLIVRSTAGKAGNDEENIVAEAVRGANSSLAEFQQIRHWRVWPEPDFPRTSTGKVLRREVAATANGEQTRRGMPTGGGLAGIIRRITGEDVSALPDSARLSEDVHLDSLGRVELRSALETRFGVSIDDAGGDAGFQTLQTLGELRALLRDTGPAAESAKTPLQEQHAYVEWPWTRAAIAVRTAFLEAIAMPLVALLAAPHVVRDASRDSAREPSAPVLIVANHVTMFDVPLLLYGLPRRTRQRVAVAMSGEMLLDWRRARGQGHWFLNLLAPAAYYLVTGLFNVFPLPQAGDFRASFAHAAKAMDRGFHVLVFPEGRRTKDGQIHPFQRGSGLLWRELQSVAVPVYLGGLWELQVNHARWFRSGRIRVHVGNAIKLPAETDPAAATALIEKAVRGLQRNWPEKAFLGD